MNLSPEEEKKIRIVMESLSATEKEARELLELAKGDVNQVHKFTPLVLKHIFYLFGKVNSRSQEPLSGIFLFIANGEKGERLLLDAIFSTHEEVSQNVDLKNITPLVIKKEIDYMRAKIDLSGDSNANKNYSLLSDFLSSPSNIHKIYNLTKEGNWNTIKQMLESAFSKWNNFPISIDLRAEYSTQFSYENFRKEVLPTANEKEGEREKEKSTLWLKCVPVVDPIAGKTIRELSTGSTIMVKINDDREFSKFIVDALKSIRMVRDNEVSAVIVNAESTQANNFLISVELARGIFGKLVVAEGVKIAVGEEPEIQKKKESPSSLMWRIVFFITLSGFIGLLIVVLRLLIK